jgi:hypothetical protein
MNIDLIEHKFGLLPEHFKKRVSDFIDFLLTKKEHKTATKKFSFDWEGGLENLKDRYSSVELQHKSMEWR